MLLTLLPSVRAVGSFAYRTPFKKCFYTLNTRLIKINVLKCKRLNIHAANTNRNLLNRYMSSKKVSAEDELENSLKDLGLIQKYKKMAKEYWYVLIPVYLISSATLLGIFFLVAKTGIDVKPAVDYAEKAGAPEFVIKSLRTLLKSSLGDLAVALILYKLVTPFRYMLYVFGTVWTIKYSVRRGWIKPIPKIPNKDQFKDMIQKNMNKTKEKLKRKD